LTDGKTKKKTEKKQKKTSVKHIRIRLIGGCVNNANMRRDADAWVTANVDSYRQLRKPVVARSYKAFKAISKANVGRSI